MTEKALQTEHLPPQWNPGLIINKCILYQGHNVLPTCCQESLQIIRKLAAHELSLTRLSHQLSLAQ